MEKYLETYYPSDYHRQINRNELEGTGKNINPVHSLVQFPKAERPKTNYVKFEYPFFLVVNPNGHKCFISDDPNLARREAWRLNNGK